MLLRPKMIVHCNKNYNVWHFIFVIFFKSCPTKKKFVGELPSNVSPFEEKMWIKMRCFFQVDMDLIWLSGKQHKFLYKQQHYLMYILWLRARKKVKLHSKLLMYVHRTIRKKSNTQWFMNKTPKEDLLFLVHLYKHK